MSTPDRPGPKLEPSEPIQVDSDIVYMEPGMALGYVHLVAYRADGRPYIQIDLPEELVASWLPLLEYSARNNDVTRHPKFLKLEP